jgi:excisionase family DNA binding protein
VARYIESPETRALEIRMLAPMRKVTRKFYNTDDVVELTGLSADNVRELIKRGTLPGTKVGRSYLLPIAEVDRVLGLARPQAA